MAEICLECWNKLNETNDSRLRYVLSWDRDFCEECCQFKRVIVVERLWSRIQRTLAEAIENTKRQ